MVDQTDLFIKGDLAHWRILEKVEAKRCAQCIDNVRAKRLLHLVSRTKETHPIEREL